MRLRPAATAVLLAAVFIVTLAYGVQLPLLPSLLERQIGTGAIAWHTGALTGAYTLALFLFAPAWGYLSDRWQRRGVILIGLTGFAAALVLFGFVDRLPALYAGRFLSGAFSAAVLPAAQALVADLSADDRGRARRFAWLNIAGLAGFLIGPAIGGALGEMLKGDMEFSGSPFLAIAAASGVLALLAARILPTGGAGRRPGSAGTRSPRPRQLRLLLLASFLLAVGLGTFEVGLALIGEQELGLTPARLGSMFMECMLVMAAAQILVFNPWFPPRATRWLLAPAFALLAAGLLVLTAADDEQQLYWAVGSIAAAAGMLAPAIGFWISLSAGKTQGRELGWQTSASSLGQTIGSALAGLLYGQSPAGGAFLLAAAGALGAAAISIPLGFSLVRRAPAGSRASVT